MSVEKPSELTQIHRTDDNEPWELEDSSEERITPERAGTTTQHMEAFNDYEFSTRENFDAHKNFFLDSFDSSAVIEKDLYDDKDNNDYSAKHSFNEDMAQSIPKNEYIDDNAQNMEATTSTKYKVDKLKSLKTNDSDELDVNNGIKSSFETSDHRIPDNKVKYCINTNETNIKVYLTK